VQQLMATFSASIRELREISAQTIIFGLHGNKKLNTLYHHDKNNNNNLFIMVATMTQHNFLFFGAKIKNCRGQTHSQYPLMHMDNDYNIVDIPHFFA
jgi:hypothetical protein